MATTPNLGLHQWQPGDSFLREDFNEDFRKIDAHARQPPFVKGNLECNGVYPRLVTLGFRPSMVFYYCQTSDYSDSSLFILPDGCYGIEGAKFRDTPEKYMIITNTGFQLQQGGYLNEAGRKATYVAFY